jgi:AhpD family alkylhydroperoxidase
MSRVLKEIPMQPQSAFNGDNTPMLVESAVTQTTDGAREGVFQEIQQTLGLVPGFFKMMPPTHVEHEWRIFQDFQLSDQTALHPKVKELIGLAVAGVLHCQYCTFFHTVAAGMHGATPQELNEAILMGKHTAGWSTYLNGARYDLEQLKREMKQIQTHMMKQQPQGRRV